jgi:hypothetical protein
LKPHSLAPSPLNDASQNSCRPPTNDKQTLYAHAFAAIRSQFPFIGAIAQLTTTSRNVAPTATTISTKIQLGRVLSLLSFILFFSGVSRVFSQGAGHELRLAVFAIRTVGDVLSRANCQKLQAQPRLYFCRLSVSFASIPNSYGWL